MDHTTAAARPHESITAARLHQARGEALYRARRIAAAEREFRRALALGAERDTLIERLWMCAMLRGDFAAAWRLSDAVLRRRRGRRADHLPRHLRWVWDGTPLAGRRVLVRCNHGLGDTLQFARLIPALARIARHVTLEAQPALLPLLASVPGLRALVPLDAPVPPCDVEIELMEVAHALRLTLERLPGNVPYLAAPSTARAAGAGGGFRLGVVWAAGAWRPERSVPFAFIERLAALPGVQLVSLQHGPAAGDVERSALRARIETPATDEQSVVETAALIKRLDLVLTVDTMVAHLAGALAAPVWTLLHAEADWRWMLERRDSPWYPTMRLFRQQRMGVWHDVLEEVLAAAAERRGSWNGAARTAVARLVQQGAPAMAMSKTTTNHETIRGWAEKRGGKPAVVRSTHRQEDPGILRLEFPDAPNAQDEALEPISWDEWFKKFDAAELALLYEEKTSGGEKSNFNKLVKRETAEAKGRS